MSNTYWISRFQQHGLEVKEAPSRHATLRRASILILLSADGMVLVTQRSFQLKSHPGECCFPGGKQDQDDGGDDWKTALRELQEEVGLIIPVRALCRLATIESLGHLCVTPFVGHVDRSHVELDALIRMDPGEVQASFWVPLDFFVKTRPTHIEELDWQGEIFLYREYGYSPASSSSTYSITGLTAHVAHQAATIATTSDAPNASSLLTTPTANKNSSSKYEGHLYRYHQHLSSKQKPFWSRRFFVLATGMLHQYDNARQATRKGQSANKKHRLRLVKSAGLVVRTIDSDPERPFGIEVELQLMNEEYTKWKLAAASQQERREWVDAIMDHSI